MNKTIVSECNEIFFIYSLVEEPKAPMNTIGNMEFIIFDQVCYTTVMSNRISVGFYTLFDSPKNSLYGFLYIF